MALMPCPECGNEVSTEAAACPKCGYRVVPDVSHIKVPGWFNAMAGIQAVLLLILLAFAVYFAAAIMLS